MHSPIINQIKKMLKLENIININKRENRYCICFSDGKEIKVKSKRSIIPLLFLIKYGKSSSNDYDNERYEYIKNVISSKEEIEIFDHEYKEKSKPYLDLIEIEGYTFIKKEVENNKNYYVLEKKDHPLLFKEHNAYEYDIEKETKKEIYHRQGYRCNICEKVITKEEGIVDYILPLLRGGKEENDNIQLICNECYTKKRKECKNCIEVCNIKNCPLFKKTNTINAMNISKIAMRKSK